MIPTPKPSPTSLECDGSNVDSSLHNFFSNDSDTGFMQLDTLERFQWTHPTSGPEDNAGNFSLEIGEFGIRSFDPEVLADQTSLAGDSATAFEFSFHDSDMHSFQSADLSSELHEIPNALTSSETPGHQTISSNASEENWPYVRCNPSITQPDNLLTGEIYLMRLEETLNDPTVWTQDNGARWHVQSSTYLTQFQIQPVSDSVRDKLMVISQGLLNRARDIHRTTRTKQFLKAQSSFTTSFTRFFILPPSTVLDYYLRIYACSVEQYLPFFPTATLSLTQLAIANDEKSSVVLLLLMIAHGAMGSPLPEARRFASGLIETCRICIYDDI